MIGWAPLYAPLLEKDRYVFGQYLKTDTDFKETNNRSPIPIISILPIQPIPIPIFFGDRYRYILLSPITDTDTDTDIKKYSHRTDNDTNNYCVTKP